MFKLWFCVSGLSLALSALQSLVGSKHCVNISGCGCHTCGVNC